MCGTLIIARGAIYFDGSLPRSKKEERHKRICGKSQEAQKYFLTTISGVKAEAGVPARFIPEPPFLVPAILEALRSHDRYGKLTSLVPGEADPYCADDVKRNGGTLLTSDSDLLLYDLGRAGSVVFLKDLQLDIGVEIADTSAIEGASSISVLRNKPSELCGRMSLEPGQLSMLRIGFELKQRTSYSPKGWPDQSKWACLKEGRAEEFAAFVAEYQRSPDSTGTAFDHMSILDPRVSEFVLDWAKNDSSGASPATKDLTVWLPSLVDRWDAASAWELGTTIRQLVYSLYQSGKGSTSTVMEYRRTLSVRSAGQAVELLDEVDIPGAIEGLLEYADRFIDGTAVPKRVQWITTCLSLEIGHATQGSKESNAVKLWREAAQAEGRLQPGNWDAVHLAAQISGTLYSFRMLQQVLEIRGRGNMSSAMSSDQVERLKELVSSLPTIPEFPAAADMEDIFEQLNQGGQLQTLSEANGVPKIVFEAKEATSRRLKGRRSKARQQERKPIRVISSQSQASTNPFEALSTDY